MSSFNIKEGFLKSKKSFFAVLVLAMGLSLALVLGQQRQETRSRASEVVTVSPPATIISDCSVDVTTQLNDWIKTVPDNAILQFGATACYRIDETVEFVQRNNLTLEGNGVTFKAVTDGRETDDPRTRQHLRFNGGSNITVRNVIVRGANPNAGTGEAAYVAALEAQHGIQLSGGIRTALLENVQIYDVYGDFVYISPKRTAPYVFASDITIRNSRFERNGRQGFAVSGAKNVVIENNYIANTRRSTVDIEPNFVTDGVSGFTFRNNDVGRGRLLFFANHGAGAPISDITFEGNRLVGRPLNSSITTPDSAARRLRYKFINNTSDTAHGGPGGGTIGFRGVDDIEIRGNTQPVDNWRPMHLVTLSYNTDNTRIIENVLPGAKGSMQIIDPVTNTNYCTANNKIRSTLITEFTSYTCPGYPTGVPTPTPVPDTTAPVVNITAPTSTNIRGKGVNIQANATDNIKVTKVEIYIDGNLKGSWTTPLASYSYYWDTQRLSRGIHLVNFKAYDAAGNIGEAILNLVK